MKRIISAVLLAMAIAVGCHGQDIYNYKVKDADGAMVSLSDYKGKVMLIVNTATKCGFTPQYEELQALYTKYGEDGLVVLDFPCNQFGEQAPGSIREIREFCTGNYSTTFPQFDKIDVNGEAADPLFTYLKSQQAYTSTDQTMKRIESFSKSVKGKDDIRWNFTKFLVDRNGKVIARFEPVDDMSKVEAAVKELL